MNIEQFNKLNSQVNLSSNMTEVQEKRQLIQSICNFSDVEMREKEKIIVDSAARFASPYVAVLQYIIDCLLSGVPLSEALEELNK